MIETKASLLATLESAGPATLERLLRWFALIEGPAADPSPDRFAKHLEWLRQGSILDLDEEQFRKVLDFVIVERAGPDDPAPDRSEIDGHRHVDRS